MNFDAFLMRMQGSWYQSVSALVLLLFAARGVGCWALPRRRDEFIRLALGMAVLAWLYPWWWPSMPGWVSAALLIPAARGVWGIRWREIGRDKWLYLALGVFGAATLGSAFLPPFTWDEQVYQTVLFARFPETFGRTDNPYSAYPLLPHFFMMWVRSWSGWSLPRLMVWFLSLLLAGKLYLEVVRRGKSALFGAVASACVMLSPLALALHREFYAEAFVALFALAGFLVLESADEGATRPDDVRRQLLAGVFAGACVAVKLTGAGAALVLVILAAKRRRMHCFIAAAAITALPFFIRPWLTFGSPFYPFGSAWWGGEKARAVENIYRMMGDYGPGKLLGAATGWFSVCVAEDRLYDGVWGIGVLALTILLLFGLWRRRDRSSLVSFAALAAGYVFWAMTSQQGRFLYPLLFISVLLLADNFRIFAERRVRLAVLALPVLGALLSCSRAYPHLKHHWIAWRGVSTARRDPGRFLAAATNDPGFFNALKLLGRTPENARVLLLGERRSLHVPRRLEHGSPLFQELRLTPVPRSADELWQGIKDFDYVLLGSTQDRIDQLKGYDRVEQVLGRHLIALQRRGRLRPVRVPDNVECQPLLEVVHEP
jgi:hypothetical protein